MVTQSTHNDETLPEATLLEAALPAETLPVETLPVETLPVETLPVETLPEATLPPSARDFEAYRLVKVERKATRAVAKLLHLSQTRVCQIIPRVAAYLVDVTQPEDDARLERQLAVAKQVAAEHIDYCMERALHSFERSCAQVRVVREVENPAGEITRTTTIRENFGETRFLTTIGRLANMGGRLPVCTLPIAVRRSVDAMRGDSQDTGTEALHDEAPVQDQLELDTNPCLTEFAQVALTELDSTPSEEACSLEAGEQPLAAAEQPHDEAARLEAIKLYNRGMRLLNLPEQQIPETVHPAESTVPFDRPSSVIAASTQVVAASRQAIASRKQTELQRKLNQRERRKQQSAAAAS